MKQLKGQGYKKIRERITSLRHKLYAHKTIEALTANIAGVSLVELRQVYDYLIDLFRTLSFGTGHCFAFGDYIHRDASGDVVPDPSKDTSLDEILDAVVKDSDWIKQPEEAFWSAVRDHKDEQELDLLTYWRKKLGMSPP